MRGSIEGRKALGISAAVFLVGGLLWKRRRRRRLRKWTHRGHEVVDSATPACCDEKFNSKKRTPAIGSSLNVHVLRLHPGMDVYEELCAFVKERNMTAAFVITCVGSVRNIKLRLANCTASNRNDFLEKNERFEIVSLTGTLGPDGCHLHASLGNKDGQVIGGHVVRGGLVVFTTAEIVVGECADAIFRRPLDAETGFGELKPTTRQRKWVSRR